MNFINSHFVLYGRKFNIIAWQGKPNYKDTTGMIAEMDQIVETYHPYGFFWSTTVCTECYAELASKGVVSFGGLGFSDAFANELAPYYYSAHESATRMETAFAQWWCNEMSSINVPSRRVKWAGNPQKPQNATQNFNGQKRILGIISPSPPDNQDTIRNYMVPLMKQLCGETDDTSVPNHIHYYFYAQDVSTAAQQVQAGNAAMDTASNPATDVLCICDIVAPAFLYSGEQSNNYWPENLIADTSGMGWDTSARGTYEDCGTSAKAGCVPHGSDTATQGCASPPQGCEYDMALGLAADGPQAGGNRSEGYKIYHLGGGSDPVAKDPDLKQPDQTSPYYVSANEARVHAINWIMIASLVENAGPNLNPAVMQARSPLLGAVGGGATGQSLLQFSAHSHQWTQDARIVYWNKYADSTYDSPPEKGTWVQMGPRYDLGQYPGAPDGPPAPTTGRSGPAG
jgi:hypothetical protein